MGRALAHEDPDSRCQLESARYLRQRRLFRFADRHAANTEKSSTFRGCLRDVLADLSEPALEGRRIARCLGVDDGAGLAERLDTLSLDLGGLAARELFLDAVARRASPLAGLEIGYDGFDERVRPGRPQSPLGSAAVTAMPAIITLSRTSFHSSGVKFDLSAIDPAPLPQS